MERDYDFEGGRLTFVKSVVASFPLLPLFGILVSVALPKLRKQVWTSCRKLLGKTHFIDWDLINSIKGGSWFGECCYLRSTCTATCMVGNLYDMGTSIWQNQKCRVQYSRGKTVTIVFL